MTCDVCGVFFVIIMSTILISTYAIISNSKKDTQEIRSDLRVVNEKLEIFERIIINGKGK